MYKKTLLTTFIILGVFLCSNAIAGTKFINKDTAKDRKPIRMGTGGDGNESQITIQSDNDSNTIRVKPKQKDEEEENQQIGPIFVVPEIKP
ncbi:hypothetical protein [Desulfovibrio sp. JC010]|uniref:hypothetical protein n=1 Tax=Desulfovibrio sp. JC010 TaxID=2593641 RepID=UPI0013D71136|nr:hypothetical protein [Desulfovibrio sp. JC010]NDV27869.1 hypothetical protein [Desulfovibrio sp. JC010]